MIEWTQGPRHQDEQETVRARKFRRVLTDAELRIWSKLRGRRFLGLKFRRQSPFGPYYLDFYCFEKRLAIELDGGQHYTPAGKAKDAHRDAYLRANGLTVKRYSDRDVLLKADDVLQDLYNWVNKKQSSPRPSPFQGEGGRQGQSSPGLRPSSPFQGEGDK